MNLHKLENYILNHISAEHPVLFELNRQTHLKLLMPRMCSGHLQGKILEMLSQMIRPLNILEIGTYSGYSAICLANGLREGGKLLTIEINDELEDFIRYYFQRAWVNDKIELKIGNAIEIIKKSQTSFDLVFIDGDKRQYPDYYDVVIDKVNAGGYIIADNILWDGKVVDNNVQEDEYTKGVKLFNEKVYNDNRVSKVILPVRDGLMILRKSY